ncbi:MAG: carbon monoxide dehydrogenase [Phycisphaerae bacterium]
MSWTLAFTGKGGVGKTTLAAIAVKWLIERRWAPVLAVDADPNTCLGGLLGLHVRSGVGAVREEVKQIVQGEMPSAGGSGKHRLLELKIHQSLIEAESFDLLAMGRPEGPGCYCYANHVLGAAVRRLVDDYRSVVMDNEAGLENLSRRIIKHVDKLVFVADPSARGLATARRLYDLAVEMEVDAGSMGLVVNRARPELADQPGGALQRAAQLFEGTPVEILGGVPEDADLRARDESAEPVFTLPESNGVYKAASAVLKRLTADRTSRREEA